MTCTGSCIDSLESVRGVFINVSGEAISSPSSKFNTLLKSMDIPRNWEFIVRCQDMVALHDIMQYVSREDPLGIMFPDNGELLSVIVIHDSIVTKSIVCGMSFLSLFPRMKKATISGGNSDVSVFVTKGKVDVDKLKTWAKKVKQAKWPSEYKEVKYTAVIPKI